MTSRRLNSISHRSPSFLLLGFGVLLLIFAGVMALEMGIKNSNLHSKTVERSSEVKPAYATSTQQSTGLNAVNIDHADYVGNKSGPGSLLLNAHAAPFSGSPYTGTAISLPGRIEAENFDNGGEGVAYHDTTSTNDGGAYRSEAVDICTCGSPYGFSVGWTQAGEWMEYTVTVSSYGSYKFQTLTATTVTGTALHVEVDGVNVTGQMILPNTGAWGSYATTSSQPVTLSAGQHIVRVGIDVAGFLIDSVDLVRLNTPYGGTAASLPGTVQAENFDNGGEGVAYHDTTTANEGGAYRSEGVDLCACGNATGYALGWSQPGEWTRYTVNAANTDTYTLQARMSTITTGCTIHLEVDGVNVTGQMVLPNTGAWDAWTTISKSNVQISAGQHDLKMVIESGGFLLDSLSALPSVPTAPSSLTANAVSTSQINLAWTDNSFNETGFKIERKTGPSGTYSEIATVAAGVTSYNNSGLQPSTQYFYRVRSTNLGGDSAYSSEASAMTSNLLPSVSVTSPGAGVVGTAPANITIQASASDSDGTITKVEFFQGATKLGEDLTSPYSFNWTNVAAGNYSLTAKATDNAGGVTTSAAVAITVNAPPTISLTAPAANATFTAGATVAISATPTDTDGTISKVEFYQGATKLGEVTTTPYTFNWTNVPQGNYSLSAVATDDRGASTTSAVVPISVVANSAARLDPMNQTGGGGENPLSRNFNWSLPIVSLPGRAGMNLGLALSYNSLVWTRNGNVISFDDDDGFPGPGFRLGFPVIQGLYHNSEVGTDAYLLIGSDGSRTELRRVGSSALFEAADSSHLLLDANTMTLRSTDGTQMTYAAMGAQFNCTQIKDRNGNYITINYNASGKIDNIHDTLDRVITFNYDTGWLSSIKQSWKKPSNPSETIDHIWASFSYTTSPFQPSFNGLTVVAAPTVTTLSSVTLADGSYSEFSYTSWGQMWKVSNFAADHHPLNYRSYNLPGSPLWISPPPQTDCPRFTERHDWAQMWNRDVNGVEQEVITTYSEPLPDSWTMPTGWPYNASVSGKRADVTTPDGTVQKIYFIDTVGGVYSAWQRGLPALVVTYDNGGVWRRKAMTVWTQDNTAVSYELNPRVSETNIYDPEGNRARVQTTYQQFTFANNTSCYLPRDVYEYDADASTILRSTRTDYNSNAVYTDRRIIGLVSERRMYQGDVNNGGALAAKMGFFYDNDNGSASIQGTDAPVQHDNTNYSAGFVTGRANLSSVRRYDITNTSIFATTRSTFNTAGAVVSVADALNHITQISYNDTFLPGVTWTTLAYPTKVTDADGYYSSFRYNFDFGAITSRTTPPANFTGNPNQQPAGPEQQFMFDDLGRLERTNNPVNTAYVRYEYSANSIRVDTFATVETGQGEAHSFEITDGLGRTIASVSDHPATTNTNPRFDAQRTVYDIMGRVTKTSNPAETSAVGNDPAQWQLVEGDLGSSWFFTQYTYDWKGRLLATINTDGTSRTAAYTGCGCAGGEVVTLTDEGTITGMAPNTISKKRQQKIYSDVLGRTIKTEIRNWDGTGSFGTGTDTTIYATTVNTYNVRDQITHVTQYAGSQGSSSHQDTSMTYDGYGRLKTRHLPEQVVDPNNSASTDHTTWNYRSDDSIDTIVDARGVIASFSFNARSLLAGITYDTSSIPSTADVSSTSATWFGYDAAGNRLSMSDGSGTVTYHYNNLSQMDWEQRTFSALPAGGSYRLVYEYNLAGQLTKVTDQRSNISFTQSRDRSGKLKSVTGVGYNGTVASFISEIAYRAWGAVKSVQRGDGLQEELTYNVRGLVLSDLVGSFGATYQYHNDGTVKFVDALTADPNGIKDRAFSYDVVGRTTTAYSGSEARNFLNNTSGGTPDGPYWRSYGYDVWGNATSESGRYWSRNDGTAVSFDSTNRNSDWTYDAEGNLITRNEQPDPGSFLPFNPLKSTFDAKGNEVGSSQTRTYYMEDSGGLVTTQYSTSQTYDSEGQVTNYTLSRSVSLNGTPTGGYSTTAFYLRSTVLGGQAISEYDAVGWRKSYVYANSERIGQQEEGGNNTAKSTWHYADPVTGDSVDTVNGASVYQTTLDPRGVNLGDSDPFPADGSGDLDGIPDGALSPFSKNTEPMPIEGGGTRCVIDGLEQFCPFVGMNEASLACANNDCGPRRTTVTASTAGGKVVASSSFWRFAGQLGWDGSLDGTYNVNSTWASQFSFGTAGGAQTFLTHVKYADEIYGSSASELFQRRSGSGGLGSNVGAASLLQQKPMDTTNTEKLLTEDCVGFLNRILAQLNDPQSKDFRSLLSEAKKRNLYTRPLTVEEKKKRLGGTHSRVGDPAFYIYLGEAEYANDPYLLIHELFHGAAGTGNGYTHFEMATAAYKAALADPAFMKYANRHGGVREPKLPDYSPDSKDPEDWYNADVFDRIARHGCTHPIDWNW